MRPLPLRPAVAGLLLVTALGGCSSTAPPTPPPEGGGAAGQVTPVPAARAQLAARAAAAKDLATAAFYTLTSPDRADRTITVVRATDGAWRVDIPGGALGGAADVSVLRTGAGLFQCTLPSPERPQPATCVAVDHLTDGINPRVQHVFADWLDVLIDRAAAITVTTATTLPGADGDCFAVEPNATALAAPLDPGIYCYRRDGTLTGARLGFGTLVLTGVTAAVPPTVDLPGPLVDGDPLPTAAPPEPPAPPTPATTPDP